MVQACAYNLPAVLLTLGVGSWRYLKQLHFLLMSDLRWKIRRSLAFSLHECAKILGPEITQNDLMPILFHFLQDIPDVAEGVLQNLPSIL